MVLGTIVEIAFLLMGIFSLINDTVSGIIIIGIVLFSWLIGFIWDKKQFGDWFYSWRQLSKLWKQDTNKISKEVRE